MESIRERIDAAVDRAMPGAEVTQLKMRAMRGQWDGEYRDILCSFVTLAEGDGRRVCWEGDVRARYHDDGTLLFEVALFWGYYAASAADAWVERCDKN